jgi:peptide/nickel transport system substrate-binding protein
MKIRLAIATLLAAATISGAAWSEELRIGVKTETSSIDPHWQTLIVNIQIDRHFFDHLLEVGDRMELKPGLATEWKAIDETTWEFKLREGVKWHDGSPFTADDVVFTFARTDQVPNAPAPFSQYTRGKTVTKIDDHTIHVSTEGPYPLMATDVAQFAIVSKKHGTGATTADYNSGKATIGTGPYKFVEYVSGDRIVLEANPDYWGGAPEWDRVTIKPIPTGPARIAALKAGDVDLIDFVPPADINNLKQDSSVVVWQGPSNRPVFLHLDSNRDLSPSILDNAGNPLWPNPTRDWRVRKAISKAISREAIVDKVMEGNAVIATQLLPEGFFGYNGELEPETYDPEGAKELLAEAGYPDGFRITLHGTHDRYINDRQIVEAVAQMVSRIGIKVNVKTHPVATYYTTANTRAFSFWLGSHSVATGEPSAQLNHLIHTTWPGTPYCCTPRGYSNPRVDDIIEEAMVTVDDDARSRLFQEAIAIAVHDVAFIPLHYQLNTWASNPSVTYTDRIDEMTLAQNASKK